MVVIDGAQMDENKWFDKEIKLKSISLSLNSIDDKWTNGITVLLCDVMKNKIPACLLSLE